MSSFPLVTVITPSYNQAAFLEQTICSVLGQDYPSIEYLIVDGGSHDGSTEIIARYADRLTWWVSEPDAGQSEAINKGLQRARGEYVSWLNSDDLYLPGAISQAVSVLQLETSLGMVYGDAITIDSTGRPLGRFNFEDWGLLDLVGFRIICQPAVFMRRSVLEKVGCLEHSFHYMLDHQLWIRIARQAPIRHVTSSSDDPTQPIQGLWAAARHHPGAKNVSQAAGFGEETLKLLQWMEKEPDLAKLIMENRRRVLAGAYRLNARYLLDAGFIRQSLVSYMKALRYRPIFALKHWHRMLYAVLMMIKLGRYVDPLVDRSELQKRRRLVSDLLHTRIAALDEMSEKGGSYPLFGWPGLNLDDSF